jgi:hypothetical protein
MHSKLLCLFLILTICGLYTVPTPTNANELNILTVQSFPIVGGNWVTQFTTEGEADLTIEGIDGTFFTDTVDEEDTSDGSINEDENKEGLNAPDPFNADGEKADLEFFTLTCGNEEFEPTKQGNSYTYPNWSCDTPGIFSSLVLTGGKHHLKFTFGEEEAFADNIATEFQWSERLGGSGADYGYGVATDTNGNVIVAGRVDGTSDLNGDGDTDDAEETGDTGVYAGIDILISVFNSSGTHQWSERLGGSGTDFGNAVATDTNNNIIVTGYVVGTGDLNGDGDTADANESDGGVYSGNDIFISVFNSSGTHQWSERLGGSGLDYGNGVATDSNNNIIVTGSVALTADLNGDGDTGDVNESNAGYALYDVIIAVFNSAGTHQWSERIGGTGYDSANDVTTDSNNNIIVGWAVQNDVDLNGDADTGDANETGGGVYGAYDGFISVFNSSGTFQWSERFGNSSDDQINGVTTDSNNNVIVGARIIGTGDLNGDGDTDDAEETGDTGVYGSWDGYISVFNSSGTHQWSERLGGSSVDRARAITTDTNNNIIVTGEVSGTADLNSDGDTDDAEETVGGVYGSYDIFISVFNSAGTHQWSERLGGSSSDTGYGVTTDSNNSVIVTGDVNGTADLNGDGDTADTNESDGGVYGTDTYDVFISAFASPDSTAPVISEVTAITTPGTDTTPDYVFTTDEAGTITYGGSCDSATTSATVGNNTITLNTLADGTYIDCTITVTDTLSNVSNTLTLSSFTIDTSTASGLPPPIETEKWSWLTPSFTNMFSRLQGTVGSTSVSSLAPNNVVTNVEELTPFSVKIPDSDQVQSVTLIINGEIYDLVDSTGNHQYEINTFAPKIPGEYPYTIRADYGVFDLKRKGVLIVNGAYMNELPAQHIPLFQTIYGFSMPSVEATYWLNRLSQGEEKTGAALYGAIQWQQLFGGR